MGSDIRPQGFHCFPAREHFRKPRPIASGQKSSDHVAISRRSGLATKQPHTRAKGRRLTVAIDNSPKRGLTRPLNVLIVVGVILALIAGVTFWRAAQAQAYEVWSLDQGTDRIHIYADTHEQIAVIDVSPTALRQVNPNYNPDVVRTVPHMVDFDSAHRYAFIAATAGGATIVIDTATREIVAVLETGPGSHMAAVTNDDTAVWVAVIGGSALVEIPLDLTQNEPTFAIGRTVDVAALLAPTGFTYPSFSPVCHDYDRYGRAWITLGPGMTQGGLIVFDPVDATVVHAFDPAVVRANCGIGFTDDGDRAIANFSGIYGADVVDEHGVWYMFNVDTFEVLEERDSGGVDAHGVRRTPKGDVFFQLNRGSSNGIVIDAATFDVVGEFAAGDTPDILDYSTNGRYAYITQRGPKPLSGDPHVAVGDTPGVLVIDTKTRETVIRLDPPVVRNADGDIINDVHGIGVRPRSGDERVVAAAPVFAPVAAVGVVTCHLPQTL